MMGSNYTKKGYIFWEKETRLGKKKIYIMVCLFYRIIQEDLQKILNKKKFVIGGGGYK